MDNNHSIADGIFYFGKKFSDDCGPYTDQTSKFYPNAKLDPIVDIVIVKNGQYPDKYSVLDHYVNGENVFQGYILFKKKFPIICFKTGTNGLCPPVVDLKLVKFQDSCPKDYSLIMKTKEGSDACLNGNGGKSNSLYLAFKLGDVFSKFAISDICLFNSSSKYISYPHTYLKISPRIKNGLLGNKYRILFKRSRNNFPYRILEPELLLKYKNPLFKNFPDTNILSKFCCPEGISLEVNEPKNFQKEFLTTCFYNNSDSKIFAYVMMFYSKLNQNNCPEELLPVFTFMNDKEKTATYFQNYLIVLSRNEVEPFFHQLLQMIYDLLIVKKEIECLERIIKFIFENNFPSKIRPKISFRLLDSSFKLSMEPFVDYQGKSCFSFVDLIFLFDVDEILDIFLYLILEQKVLVHSIKCNLIFRLCETLKLLIFPLQWQGSYIPLCPLNMSELINSPVPFIIGANTEMFNTRLVSKEITCMDLSNDHIQFGSRFLDKEGRVTVQLPKFSKMLRNNLMDLSVKLHDECFQDRRYLLDMSPEKKIYWDYEIKYHFMRFFALLFIEYKNYLFPTEKMKALLQEGSSDIFNLKAFKESRNDGDEEFYDIFTKTQHFNHFIIEATKNQTQKNPIYEFFDTFQNKLEGNTAKNFIYRILKNNESIQYTELDVKDI